MWGGGRRWAAWSRSCRPRHRSSMAALVDSERTRRRFPSQPTLEHRRRATDERSIGRFARSTSHHIIRAAAHTAKRIPQPEGAASSRGHRRCFSDGRHKRGVVKRRHTFALTPRANDAESVASPPRESRPFGIQDLGPNGPGDCRPAPRCAYWPTRTPGRRSLRQYFVSRHSDGLRGKAAPPAKDHRRPDRGAAITQRPRSSGRRNHLP